jgi:hypothetical protein
MKEFTTKVVVKKGNEYIKFIVIETSRGRKDRERKSQQKLNQFYIYHNIKYIIAMRIGTNSSN